jgi:phospholipid/cholesterol/gamma-HCH transport system substrate-binding protein
MISARTKKQLMVFVLITLLGVSFVGARYAKLGRLVHDSDYAVNTRFASSGGIFTGSEVDYRGVGVGRVSDMKLIPGGVDVVLSINKNQRIPADTRAIVANRSAIGEQYVELEPRTSSGPYLKDGSTIRTSDTEVPIPPTELLTNLDNLVNSVPQDDLRTVVSEMGTAFAGTGRSLGQIIDTSNSFISSANQNFDVTTALIRDSDTVLSTQSAKESAIRSFARDLSLFSGTLAGSDRDLRTLIDNGSATVTELRTFIEQNQVPLGQLINNLVTTGEVQVAHLKGIRQILVLYPFVVGGGYTVLAKGPGGYDARFGMILNNNPTVCHHGYEGTDRRSPQDTSNRPMYTGAHCAEPATQSSARGAQHAPNGRTGAAYRAPVASYDPTTGKVVWADRLAGRGSVASTGGAEQIFGRDSGAWLLLQTAVGSQGAGE